MNYDGYWETFDKGTVIAGNPKVMEWIDKEIAKTSFAAFPLNKALQEACKLLEKGKQQGETDKEEDQKSEEPKTLKEFFKQWHLEAVVLCAATDRKATYRAVSAEEISQLKTAVAK